MEVLPVVHAQVREVRAKVIHVGKADVAAETATEVARTVASGMEAVEAGGAALAIAERTQDLRTRSLKCKSPILII